MCGQLVQARERQEAVGRENLALREQLQHMLETARGPEQGGMIRFFLSVSCKPMHIIDVKVVQWSCDNHQTDSLTLFIKKMYLLTLKSC